jgi:hypothetical protein
MKVEFSTSFLKRLWMVWVAIVLGPFALWFAMLSKWHRRNQIRDYPLVLGALWFATLAAHLVLFALPLHHGWLVSIHLISVGFSSWLIFRAKGLELFHFGPVTKIEVPTSPANHIGQSLMAAGIAILPLAYLTGLATQLFELRAFSIQWPASVYLDALIWALLSLPLVLALGYLLWRSPLRSHARTILLFFASLAVVGAWVAVWEVFDTYLLDWLWGGIREPLLFDPRTEQDFRKAVKIFFFASGGLLAIDYLVLAQGSAAFARRALFIGLPAGMAYAQMLFILGDWNYYLGALQSTLLREQHLGAYSLVAASKAARVPDAFRTPYDLEELAEYHYQGGDTSQARAYWRRIQFRLESGSYEKPYASTLGRRAGHYVGHLEKRSQENPSAAVSLPLRLIRPAAYLDSDWYALLSAIGYLRPNWSDLEIKKRLLSVSSSLQMVLPALTSLPTLRVYLDKLGIEHRAAFADRSRLREALARKSVPFVNLNGQWVAVCGYDAARDAYIYLRYPERYERNPWWGAPELDVLGEKNGITAGSGKTPQVPIRRAMPAPEFERNLHDIGGVALFLGDTTWIKPQEDRAAFLVELGDAYYQEQENDPAAASAYAQAQALWPNDYVVARILYLKRRWQVRHQDPGDYTALFRPSEAPKWLSPMDPEKAERVTQEILSGLMGQYLLLNWVPRIPPKGADNHEARLDSAESAYKILRQLEPSQALYVDSLAALAHRRAAYRQEAQYLDTLSRYHPFGDADVQFRLAWAAFLAGDTVLALRALDGAEEYSHHPRHDLIAGAIDCGQGRRRQGRAKIERSLKQDKSEPRVHLEWRRCQEEAEQRQPYLETWESRTR